MTDLMPAAERFARDMQGDAHDLGAPPKRDTHVPLVVKLTCSICGKNFPVHTGETWREARWVCAGCSKLTEERP